MKHILIYDNFTFLWWVFARSFTQLRRHLEDILAITSLPVASQLTPQSHPSSLCNFGNFTWLRMSKVARPTENSCNFGLVFTSRPQGNATSSGICGVTSMEYRNFDLINSDRYDMLESDTSTSTVWKSSAPTTPSLMEVSRVQHLPACVWEDLCMAVSKTLSVASCRKHFDDSLIGACGKPHAKAFPTTWPKWPRKQFSAGNHILGNLSCVSVA